MFRIRICFGLFIFYLLQAGSSKASLNNNTLLIIVSFDGFRFDYVDRNLTETLVSLKSNSSYSPYMRSVFPTKTFPNHFTIATGLYSEVHGVLDNKVFDQSTNKTLGYGYELFHYNEDVTPIWTLNERGGGGRRSGCMMWPGSNFPYQGTLPSHFMVYNSSVPWHKRVDTVLGWFLDVEAPINLGMMYFEQPDTICHQFGPDSLQVDNEIARVDQVTRYLLQQADHIGILNQLNIVFLSDHGGQAVKVPENLIYLDDFVNRTLYRYDGVPPNLQIFPVEGRESEVVEALRSARKKRRGNFSTFTLQEMPERWHYKHCRRTPPVLVTADPGYLFQVPDYNFTVSPSVIGTHGYEPEVPTMRAFFLATGPAFRRNFTTAPFENIHVYPLAAQMLGLELPALRPNGSISYLQDILVVPPITLPESNNETAYIVAGLIIVTVCVLTLFGWLIAHKNHKRKENIRKTSSASYKVLTQNADEERQVGFRQTVSSDMDEDLPQYT